MRQTGFASEVIVNNRSRLDRLKRAIEAWAEALEPGFTGAVEIHLPVYKGEIGLKIFTVKSRDTE